MRQYNPSEALISIHVPKCGGTSLKEILFDWFGENLFLHYFNEKTAEKPEKYNLGSNICIHGHFNKKRNFGVDDYYPEAKQFITILRDPFEIIVSRYFYEKKREVRNHNFRDGNLLHLNDNIDKYLYSEIYKKDYHPNLLDYMPCKITLDNYIDIIEEKFIFIGIQEDLQRSIDILSNKLGFRNEKIESLNISRRYQFISVKYREMFIETHMLEYKLYNYVKKKYRK